VKKQKLPQRRWSLTQKPMDTYVSGKGMVGNVIKRENPTIILIGEGVLRGMSRVGGGGGGWQGKTGTQGGWVGRTRDSVEVAKFKTFGKGCGCGPTKMFQT